MRNLIFLWIALLVIFAVSCGGGGTDVNSISDPVVVPGENGIFGIDKAGNPILMGKSSSEPGSTNGSWYLDPEEDEFNFDGNYYSYNDFDWSDADNPVDWPHDWARRWGGYMGTDCDRWSLVFDYGEDSWGDGANHYWVDSEIVEGDFGQGSGFYMHYTFANVPTNAPSGANEGYPDGGEQSFYGFADAAVHFWNGENAPRSAGKFDYQFDLTDGGNGVPPGDFNLIDGELYLPLFDGGKKGEANYAPDSDEFMAIHATVAYIEWVEDVGVEGEEGYVPAHYEYQEPKNDDTGWGICAPWIEKKGVDYVLFDAFDDRTVGAVHTNADAYWRITLTDDGGYPWFSPQANPFNGWCTDPTGFRNNKANWIISCYDPILVGTYSESDHYDLISWILNEVNNGDGTEIWHRANTNFDSRVVQRSVWYLKYGMSDQMVDGYGGVGNGGVSYNNNQNVRDLLDAAKANGENYTPGPGEWFAALLIPIDTREFIGTEPNPNYGGYWFGYSQVNIIGVDP